MTDNKTLKDALSALIAKKGRKSLENPEMLDAYLYDLVPQDAETVELLIQVAEGHYLDELAECPAESIAKNTAAALSDCSHKYAKDQVQTLCDIFSYVFALKKTEITPYKTKKTPKSNKPVHKKETDPTAAVSIDKQSPVIQVTNAPSAVTNENQFSVRTVSEPAASTNASIKADDSKTDSPQADQNSGGGLIGILVAILSFGAGVLGAVFLFDLIGFYSLIVWAIFMIFAYWDNISSIWKK